jgi:hypothetical protein
VTKLYIFFPVLVYCVKNNLATLMYIQAKQAIIDSLFYVLSSDFQWRCTNYKFRLGCTEEREREREREREKPLGHFFSLGVSSLAGCQSHWMVRPLGWSPDHQSKGESTQKAKISNDFWHFTIDRVVPPSRRASFQSQSTCLLDALIFKRFSITLFVYLMHITFGRSAF